MLARAAEVADSSKARRRGLLGRDSLAEGEGLLIRPCEAVHSFGMRFAIDVLFLARDGRVVRVVSRLKPWRIALCLRAHSTLELPAGTARATGTVRGDAVTFG